MRILVVATLVVLTACIVPSSAAGPANGVQPTASLNTFYAHVDQDSDDFWFSNALDEPNRWEGGWGSDLPGAGVPGELDWVWYNIPMNPGPTADILIDTGATVGMQIGAARYNPGAGNFHVATTVYVDGEVFASGSSALPGMTSVGFGATSRFEFDLTPQLDTIPAGAEVVWHIGFSGVSTEWYLDMYQGETQMTWPIVDAAPVASDPEPTDTTTVQPTPTTTTTTTSRPATTTTTTGPATTTAPSTTATATGEPVNDVDAGSQESPGAAPLLLLAALAGIVIVRRKL